MDVTKIIQPWLATSSFACLAFHPSEYVAFQRLASIRSSPLCQPADFFPYWLDTTDLCFERIDLTVPRSTGPSICIGILCTFTPHIVLVRDWLSCPSLSFLPIRPLKAPFFASILHCPKGLSSHRKTTVEEGEDTHRDHVHMKSSQRGEGVGRMLNYADEQY